MRSIAASEKGLPALLREVSRERLPEADVAAAVSPSSLNYKDAIALRAAERRSSAAS